MITQNAILRIVAALIAFALAGHASAEGTWIADAEGCKIWDPNPKPNESVTWSGACANGYADGFGTLQWTVDGALSTTFEGTLSGGKTNGKGKETGAKGDSYEGDFVDGMHQGKGITNFTDGARYEGDYAEGKRTGKGAITFKNGNHYEGDFVDGKLTGNGVYTLADGTRYTGTMNKGAATGKGTMKFASGDIYEGDFVNGKRTGKGVYTWASGERYEGDLVDGKKEGKGINVGVNGDRYEGAFVNDKFEGLGTMQYAAGKRYEGYWKAGKYDGMGKITNRGRMIDEAEFKAGERVGPGNFADSPAWFNTRGCAPAYSKDALDAKEGGIARVQFEIDADGRLLSAKITQSTGFPDLDQATVAALSRCEFKARIKDGRRVASTFSVEYEWKPIPPKISPILTQLKDDEGAVLVDILLVNVKNLDHPEQIRKQNGYDAKETKLRNLATNKKYKAKFEVGVGIFVVPEGNYCLDSFSGSSFLAGKFGDSYFHWCKGESITVTKGIINNAGEWWFAQGQPTEDDEYHAPFVLIGAHENTARALQKAVNQHPELLEN